MYEVVSREALRAACEYRFTAKEHAATWRLRLLDLLNLAPSAELLPLCGVTVELLAYCGIPLHALIMRHYRLEHLIVALKMSFADLRLLGFRLELLRDKQNYPLIALYDHAGVRADDLFALDVGYNAFARCLFDTDARYVRLLDINLDYWRKILGAGERQ